MSLGGIRRGRFAILAAVTVAVGAAVGYAASGTALVGFYSSNQVTDTQAISVGVTEFTVDGRPERGGPVSRALFPGGTHVDSDTAPAVTGWIAVQTRATDATASASGSQATSTIGGLNLFNGAVKATQVKGVSNTVVTGGTTVTANSTGTSITGLVVNGQNIAVSPGKVVPVKSNGVRIARLVLIKTQDTYSSGHWRFVTIALRLIMEKPSHGLVAGDIIDFGRGRTDAYCCGAIPV